MNKNSLIILNSSTTHHELVEKINNTGLNIFDAQSFSELLNLNKVIDPAFIVSVINTEIELKVICDIAKKFSDKLFYVYGNIIQTQQPNVYSFDNHNELIKHLSHNIKNFYTTDNKKECDGCYTFIVLELKSMGFSSKHIGCTYLKEVITELFKNRMLFNCFYKRMYPLLATRYNSSAQSIEKSIRFCIMKAYRKNQNSELKTASTKNGPPTIKELVTFLLDKYLLARRA